MSNNETTKQPAFCPSCGYTKNDEMIHGDHYLCKNAGNAPWEKPVSTPSSAATPEAQTEMEELGRKLTLVDMAFHDVCCDFLPEEGFQERKAQYLKGAAAELQMLETVLPDLLKEIVPAISSAPPSPQTSALVVGDPCPTCKRKYLGEMGPGEYSCVLCGMGLTEPCEHWKNNPTNFVSSTALPSCHVCGDQMIGLCKTCGARTDPQPGEPPAQGIGGHYSCVICGMAMAEPCEHWRGLAINDALDLNAQAQTGTDPQPSAEQEIIAKLVEALKKSKRAHYICEDSWYDCSQSEECADELRAGKPCDCGADKYNASIDALLSEVAAYRKGKS